MIHLVDNRLKTSGCLCASSPGFPFPLFLSDLSGVSFVSFRYF